MIEIRYPHLSGSLPEQMEQLKSYLYQLVDQLNYALDELNLKAEETKEEKR